MKRLLFVLILALVWSCSSDNDRIVDNGNGNGNEPPDTNKVHGWRIRAVNYGTADLIKVVIRFPLTNEVVDLGPIKKGEATSYTEVTFAFEWVDADIKFICQEAHFRPELCEEDTVVCEYRMADRPQGWLASGDYTYRIWNYEQSPLWWYATLVK